MKNIEKPMVTERNISYDEAPVAEATVGAVDYRVDAGLGNRVAISGRAEGTWRWAFLAEGQWDGSRLRASGVDHAVRGPLGEALSQSTTESDE